MSSKFLQSQPGAEPVIAEAVFRAPADRIFEAWTDPDQIMKWFGPKAGSLVSADIDLRVGGQWRFVLSSNDETQNSLEGRYEIVEPDERLQFTWSHVKTSADGAREATPESIVTVTLEPFGEATRLHLRHQGINQREGREGVGRGWETTLAHLRDLVETV